MPASAEGIETGEAAAGRRVLSAVAELHGGPELLEITRDEPEAALVGGAVRDLLLGATPRELDVLVPA